MRTSDPRCICGHEKNDHETGGCCLFVDDDLREYFECACFWYEEESDAD